MSSGRKDVPVLVTVEEKGGKCKIKVIKMKGEGKVDIKRGNCFGKEENKVKKAFCVNI
jgi:hypothetical protein